MRISFFSGIVLLAPFAASPALALEAAEPFAAPRDSTSFERALECLTQAVYYEARSQSLGGQRAVAQVVLNRVRHPNYPNSVCGVVYQGSHRVTGCQFTFTCDGSLAYGIEPYAWALARDVAEAALRGNVYRPVGLATHYHTTAIRPYWAPSLVPQLTLGAHIFYRTPGSGTADAFYQAPAEVEPEAGAIPVRTANRGLRRNRPVRDRDAPVELVEIPVVERPVTFRTLSGGSPRPAAIQAASRSQPRAAPVRRGPRVTYQGGVRVIRGS